MDALDVLKKRRSIRHYKPDEVPAEIIEDIIDCGRLAATARNVQPWHFVVVTEKEKRNEIADLADYGKFIAEAPVCIVVACEDSKYYLEDGSAATQNILLAAKAHGLGSCWVAGDKKPYAKEVIRLLGGSDKYKLISLVSLGYSRNEGNPSKKKLDEVLDWEKFR